MPTTSHSLPVWLRAHGNPIFQGLIKESPSDFQVTEKLGFPLSGDGEHDYLWIAKEGANTQWVARQLARHAGVAGRDVGFSGLKDRNAQTQQWFSVRRPDRNGTDWNQFAVEGVRVVETTRHTRKLKRGAHKGNQFRIGLRNVPVTADDISQRLEKIRSSGVPNYFGEQRFGHRAGNMGLAASLFGGKRLPREKRSIALSAARSFLFNEVLSTRVAEGSWSEAIPGDSMNLEGSGSLFHIEDADTTIARRVSALDIHPTGMLWGEGELSVTGRPAELERSVAAAHSSYAEGLVKQRTKMARRSLRLVVSELQWEFDDTTLWLSFHLGRGAYATSVLRELVQLA